MRRALVVVLLAAGTSTGAWQPAVLVSRPEGSVARGVEWIDAVLAHVPGEPDAPLTQVASWPSEPVRQLQVEIASIRRLIRNPDTNAFFLPHDFDARGGSEIRYSGRDRTLLREAATRVTRRGWSDADLAARGVVLHTDIALLAGGAGRVLRYADGERLDIDRAPVDHWRAARTLADMIDRRHRRAADLVVWAQATLAWMVATQHWNAAHTEHAVDRFGDDADVRFLAGCLHEMLAAPRTQAFVQGGGVPAGLESRVGSRNAEIQAAADLFRRAVELAPGHTEARMRYGRMLTLAGRALAAVPELRRAVAETTDPARRYYAQLFLGAALEATGQHALARTAYEAAAALAPRAQAPRLALGHLAYATGQRGDAAAAIAPLLALPEDDGERDDPWWRYLPSTGRDAQERLAEARRRLTSPPPR